MTNPTALKAIAEAATPGEWRYVHQDDPRGQPVPYYAGLVCLVQDGPEARTSVVAESSTVRSDEWEANAAFIATFDPPTVLALLSEIEEKDRRIEALVKALKTADQDLLQLHDWIAEETDHTDRIMAASEMVKRVRSTLRTDVSQRDDLNPADGWLPIVLCPTDGVDRMLRLPDGTEIAGAFHNGGLGRAHGWETKAPFEYERPIYEYPLRGGFLSMPWEARPWRPEPQPAQIGTRKDVMWLVGRLPDGVYPTHFRPNDTVRGPALALPASPTLEES